MPALPTAASSLPPPRPQPQSSRRSMSYRKPVPTYIPPLRSPPPLDAIDAQLEGDVPQSRTSSDVEATLRDEEEEDPEGEDSEDGATARAPRTRCDAARERSSPQLVYELGSAARNLGGQRAQPLARPSLLPASPRPLSLARRPSRDPPVRGSTVYPPLQVPAHRELAFPAALVLPSESRRLTRNLHKTYRPPTPPSSSHAAPPPPSAFSGSVSFPRTSTTSSTQVHAASTPFSSVDEFNFDASSDIMMHEISLKPSVTDDRSLGGYDAPGYDAPTLDAYDSPAPAYDAAPVYGYKLPRPSLTVNVKPSAASLASGTTLASNKTSKTNKNSASWYIAPHLRPHWNFMHEAAARKEAEADVAEERMARSRAHADARAKLEGVPRNMQPHPNSWENIPGTAKTTQSGVNPMHVIVLDRRPKEPAVEKRRGCAAGAWAWCASWFWCSTPAAADDAAGQV